MIPNLVHRISKSLSFGRSTSPDSTPSKSAEPQTLHKHGSNSSNDDGNITSLRRQSTRQLSSEGEHSVSISSVSRTRSSFTSVSVRKELSKRTSGAALSSSSKQLSRRQSKLPSRFAEDEESPTRSLSKGLSSSSKSGMTERASLSRPPSKAPSRQASLAKTPSLTRKGSKTPERSLSKKQSLSKADSKASVRKAGSVKQAAPAPAKKVKPGGKVLWFPAGAYLSVRGDAGQFYLCRAVNNVYNTSKEVKIRWLSKAKDEKKKRKKSRKGARKADDGDGPAVAANDMDYKLSYADYIEPTSILMQVSLEKNGTKWTLDLEDMKETERLLHMAEDVEAGVMDKDDIDEDVEEVIIVEPPAKKHKTEGESGTKEKKPRLKKTASQKERDKARKVQERLEKKQKKKEAGEGRKRKVPKKEEELTLHPNPKVKVLEKDPLWDTNVHMPYVSKYANARLAFRAVKLNDMKMLKKLLKDPERVCYLTYWKSVSRRMRALTYAVEMNNRQAVDLLWEDYFGKKYAERIRNSTFERTLLDRLGTGSYNFRSLGIGRIRPIMASRGAREGNNALTKDVRDMEDGGDLDENTKKPVLLAALKSGASEDLIMKLMRNVYDPAELDETMVDMFTQHFVTILGLGCNAQAAQLLKKITEHGTYRRLPGLLYQVLADKADSIKSIPPSQVTFKSTRDMKGFTLIHAAACNPDTGVLEKVLNADPNISMADAKGRRPIHFAAGCSSPGPLNLLLERGANPFDTDSVGMTALHYAIQARRTKNTEILLKIITDKDSRYVDPTEGLPNGGVNRASKRTYFGPLHRACEGGQLDVVKLLIKHGANLDMKTSLTDNSLTPLMIAASKGHLEIVRALVDAGAVVELPDRLGRTALIHAAMNGATNVMTYLLNIGASPNRADTSGNSPLHYAAAYGWYFSVKTLLEAGANPAVSNDWRTTPLSVAYLKGHHGIVSLLLDDDRVDVNFPDDRGQTLLAIACSSEPEPGLLEQISYLIKDKGADCKVIDTSGKTVLHHLATVNVYETIPATETEKAKVILNQEAEKVTMSIAKLFIEHGCDPTLRDASGDTAAMIALTKTNMKLAQHLVEQGSEIYGAFDSDPPVAPTTLLHKLACNLFGQGGNINDVIKFLTKTLTVKGEKKTYTKELCSMAKTYDSSGFTPFLHACRSYSQGAYNENHPSYDRSSFENARTFLKNLVEVAKSDVNACSKPTWVNPTSEAPPRDEENAAQYVYRSEAKWTPIFYLLKGPDPVFDSEGNYQKEIKHTTLKYVLAQGAEVDVYGLAGRTPLLEAICEVQSADVVRVLLTEGKADVNLCQRLNVYEGDGKYKIYAVPPICCTVLDGRGKYEILEELLKHDVDVSARDERNQFTVLHYLANCKHEEGHVKAMEQVLDRGLNPDGTEKDGMTALHMLVKNNTGGIDDNFDGEILLISRKAKLAVQDKQRHIPLHYTFSLQLQDQRYERSRFGFSSSSSNTKDPVELCKLLVKTMKKADISIKDNQGRTPLHYAALQGASICCMYLLQKGAEPNVKDKEGNTPLALAIKSGHDSCGGILIQHGVDLMSSVVYVEGQQNEEDEKEKPPVWKWKPLTMVKKPEPVQKVPLFQEAIKKNLVGVSFLILEWPVEKSGITLGDAVEMAIKNNQYNVALRLLSTTINAAEVCAERAEGRNLLHILALHADDNNLHLQTKIADVLIDRGVPANKGDRFNCTPMLYAALSNNLDLARYFQGRVGTVNVKYTDNFGRNLATASLWNCYFSGPPGKLWEWLEELIKKKIDINRKMDYPLLEDVFGTRQFGGDMQDPDYWQSYPQHGTTPLIFLLHCQDFTFTHNILQWGANPNFQDAGSLTPLMHAVKLNKVKFVKQLLKYDYDPNKDDIDPPKPPNKQKKQAKKNVFRLKKMESIASATSSESEEEEEEAETGKKQKEYRAIKKTSPVNLNQYDKRGWTALHHAACPLTQGTYDNDEMVFVLVKAGAKADMKNSDGQTPLDLALDCNAPRVAAMLQKLKGVAEKNMKHPSTAHSDFEVDDGVSFAGPVPDFHRDADRQLGGGEEQMDEDKTFEAEVSKYCNVTDGTIVMDEDQDLPYEVLMTKCDARQREYGLYNFYQIQLVHQAGKDLYILFTRWGRIGDSGQYQHTPFQQKEAAVKEFCKIFREKSGNKWTDVKSFEQKPQKYRLVPWEERQPPPKRKEIEFNFESRVKCTVPASLQKVVKIMMDMKTLQKSYSKDIHLDTDVLPFGRFNRDKLLKAKQLLEVVGKYVNKITDYRRDRTEKTQEQKQEHQADCEKVSELSSEYFQLIPQKNFVYESLRPLDQERQFQRQFQLVTNLLDFEVASRMLLGAMHRKDTLNPVDYVYQSLRCKLELMKEEDPMAQCILRYVYISSPRAQVEAIYKVERGGEEDRLRKSLIDNRRYLWHGTDLGNMLSILNRGLVVTPLDSNLSGDLYGKGIYFSDLFEKSERYCASYSSDSGAHIPCFMLLCEAALGKQRLVLSDPMTDADKKSGYNSTYVPGYHTLDPAYDVRFPSGVTMPLGDKSTDYYYEDPKTGERHRKSRWESEFVVYNENQVCIRYLVQFRK